MNWDEFEHMNRFHGVNPVNYFTFVSQTCDCSLRWITDQVNDCSGRNVRLRRLEMAYRRE